MTLVVLLAYLVVYLCVEFIPSPTDRTAILADGTAVSFLERDVGGAGPSVVLIHGSPADAGCWIRYLRETGVDEVSAFVAVDRFDFGNSTFFGDHELETQARVVEPFLDRRPILVGHSYGAPVALRAAVDHPDRIAGLVLVAGALDPAMRDSKGFRRFLDFISPVVPTPWEVSNRELYELNDENREMTSLLDRVTCPVVVVHGTGDSLCPYEGNVGHVRDSLPNAAQVAIIRLDGAGHMLHLSHVDAIDAAIRKILAPER